MRHTQETGWRHFGATGTGYNGKLCIPRLDGKWSLEAAGCSRVKSFRKSLLHQKHLAML